MPVGACLGKWGTAWPREPLPDVKASRLCACTRGISDMRGCSPRVAPGAFLVLNAPARGGPMKARGFGSHAAAFGHVGRQLVSSKEGVFFRSVLLFVVEM